MAGLLHKGNLKYNTAMEYFVKEKSVVRKIWGKSDTILFIFAGASAEFALNKAVDWLYFTGRLPADPLGRLFSTVSYARQIVFLPREEALAAIHRINAVHTDVENKRRSKIPQWAYRDVLYMLIGYSIRAYELLEQKLTVAEKQEVFDVFYRVGLGMGIEDLPANYKEWLPDREAHLERDLEKGKYSIDLYKQYRKHLGPVRYWFLLQVQELVCPRRVKDLLEIKPNPLIPPALVAYKASRNLKLDHLIKSLLLPSDYKEEIRELDRFGELSRKTSKA
ncbi:oxygenase MpaB family protein [Salinimicrobium terrae]|uniref:oxygenase MpaB family protein n=1 Tax=Salinimicrobium terrae TaxID=470866 RepID=UPI0004230245|nr:oxygenase MpaB family protein [Salinimicrobium terrae]